MSKKLSETFDILPVEVIDTSGKSSIVVQDGAEDEDFIYVRAKHYELTERGSEALDIAMHIARESENPRAIEVLGTLIKNLSEVNKALLNLNKDKAEVKTAKGSKSNPGAPSIGTAVQTQNNIIFSGTSKELNKLLSKT